MSKIATYKALEAQIAEQLAQLDALKQNKELKRELEFEQKVRDLLGEYNYSLRDIVLMLDPQARQKANSGLGRSPTQRRQRQTKTYVNPHSNERVETKGGNHRVLKAWKEKYGATEVESWLQ